MIRNWNQRVDVKRDNRLYGIKFHTAEKYSKTIGMWEIMSGTIHINKAEYGQRPKDKMVARFELRCYGPYEHMLIEIKPIEHKRITATAQTFDNTHLGEYIPFPWVLERVVDSWLRYAEAHEREEETQS